VLLGALCVILGIFATAASTLMFDRGARRFDVVETQLRLVKGEPAIFEGTVVYLPTNQNRILIPLALTSLVRAGIEPLVAYTIVRLLSAIAMFAGVAWTMARTTLAAPRVIAAALLVLALALLPSFNYGWEQPSDFPDVLFTTALAATAAMKQRWLVLGVAALAAANRESAVFAGVMWAAIHGRGTNGGVDAREIGFGAFVATVAMGVVLALR